MSDKNKPPVAEFFAKFNFRGAIVPLVFLVVGILFIVFPESLMSIICYILGGLMLAAGIARLCLAATLPAGSRFADLVFACVIIAVGILLLAAQQVVADFVTVVLGIVLIIDAVLKIEENMVLRKLNPARWRMGLAVAVVCLALGVAVVALSFSDSSSALMIVAGVSMVFDSVCSLAILVLSAVKDGAEEQSDATKSSAKIIDIEDDDDGLDGEYEDDDDGQEEFDL